MVTLKANQAEEEKKGIATAIAEEWNSTTGARKMRSLVYGVGVNDADYHVSVKGDKENPRKVTWRCPFYSRWANMLKRCYCEKYQEKRPTYKGVTVCDDWLTFSKFKAWMETKNWEGNHLDKDALSSESKIYSPDTCAFISSTINSFINDSLKSRGDMMLGVSWSASSGKFMAKCRDPISEKQVYLGVFASEIDAHLAWKKKKLEILERMKGEIDDKNIYNSLVDRFS